MSNRPHDLPFTEHFQQMPCGSRAKYMGARCRCMLCRAANSRYETERAVLRRNGDWNGLVSAEPVRLHLLALSKKHVGYKSVAAASDVAPSILHEVRCGKKTQIRARTERRVLAVTADALADGSLVPAGPTRRRLTRLLAEGFTKTELARRLGSSARVPKLQIRGCYVLASTALKVERFFGLIMAGANAGLSGRKSKSLA